MFYGSRKGSTHSSGSVSNKETSQANSMKCPWMFLTPLPWAQSPLSRPQRLFCFGPVVVLLIIALKRTQNFFRNHNVKDTTQGPPVFSEILFCRSTHRLTRIVQWYPQNENEALVQENENVGQIKWPPSFLPTTHGGSETVPVEGRCLW